MKKFLKWFFGIKEDYNDGFSYPIHVDTPRKPYQIAEHAIQNMTYYFDMVTAALIVCKLCGAVTIDWIYVFLPVIIKTVFCLFDDCLGIVIKSAQNKIREKQRKQKEKKRAEYETETRLL